MFKKIMVMAKVFVYFMTMLYCSAMSLICIFGDIWIVYDSIASGYDALEMFAEFCDTGSGLVVLVSSIVFVAATKASYRNLKKNFNKITVK